MRARRKQRAVTQVAIARRSSKAFFMRGSGVQTLVAVASRVARCKHKRPQSSIAWFKCKMQTNKTHCTRAHQGQAKAYIQANCFHSKISEFGDKVAVTQKAMLSRYSIKANKLLVYVASRMLKKSVAYGLRFSLNYGETALANIL